MSFFNDDNDKDKDKFFSPVSFNSAKDTTTSWAYESSKNSTGSIFDSTSKSSDSFNAFTPVASSAANETKSSGNFFSTSEVKGSAFGNSWGTPGYNSHSKDQDIFSLKQQAEDSSRFGHWTPQNSYLEAENAIKNLEDKDWNNRFGGSSWAFEKTKEDSSWAYSTSEKSESDWSMKIPSTKSSNWAFSTPSDSSSNWAYSPQSLDRWGHDSGPKESAGDNFNLFNKKKA